jgi:hypothetical protein
MVDYENVTTVFVRHLLAIDFYISIRPSTMRFAESDTDASSANEEAAGSPILFWQQPCIVAESI